MLTETQDNEEIIARVAALDIGKAELVCCVRVPDEDRPGRRLQEVETYSTMTRSLLGMADHLRCLVLAATLFAHESATFDVHVLAGLGGDVLPAGWQVTVAGCRAGGVAGRRGSLIGRAVRLGGCQGDRARRGGWRARRWLRAAAR
jgi:hypothetical protein